MSANANDKDGSSELPAGIDWKAFTPEDSPKTPIDVFADPLHQDLGTPHVATGTSRYCRSSSNASAKNRTVSGGSTRRPTSRLNPV